MIGKDPLLVACLGGIRSFPRRDGERCRVKLEQREEKGDQNAGSLVFVVVMVFNHEKEAKLFATVFKTCTLPR